MKDFNLEAKKLRKAIATEESRKIGDRKPCRDAVSFPEWRELAASPTVRSPSARSTTD
jgi:hypothetical protein